MSTEQLAAVAAALQACGFTTGLHLQQLLSRAPAVLGRRPEDIYAVRRYEPVACLQPRQHHSLSMVRADLLALVVWNHTAGKIIRDVEGCCSLACIRAWRHGENVS